MHIMYLYRTNRDRIFKKCRKQLVWQFVEDKCVENSRGQEWYPMPVEIMCFAKTMVRSLCETMGS